jgi:hypothetical protein
MQYMTKMTKNPKFLRSREYGLWIPTTICSIKLKENKNFMQDVGSTIEFSGESGTLEISYLL